jgi:hypothetical protein
MYTNNTFPDLVSVKPSTTLNGMKDPAGNHTPMPSVLRLILYQGELLRLPRFSRGVEVLSGVAWVTDTGRDMVLAPGDKASLQSGKFVALVSAVGNNPLVLSVWDGKE